MGCARFRERGRERGGEGRNGWTYIGRGGGGRGGEGREEGGEEGGR